MKRALVLLATTATILPFAHHHAKRHGTIPQPRPLRVSRDLIRRPLPAVPRQPASPAAQGSPRPAPLVATPAEGSGRLNFRRLALCESSDNPRAVDPSGTYFGLFQFDERTWRSVGGKGNPADASRAEQTFRARILYGQRGRQPWPVCGANL